ncbi:MAG: hypothetical protein K5640_05055 [Treponema sp.]|nr:hypothetical protein [Treponema sp.]
MEFLVKNFQKHLKKLFDYQKIEKNAHLEEVIKKSESSDDSEKMDNEDLEHLSAAGTGFPRFTDKV